jgi:hypothetical protein
MTRQLSVLPACIRDGGHAGLHSGQLSGKADSKAACLHEIVLA